MKKLLLSISMLSILFISSCGDDDSDDTPSIGLSGTLNFDGQSYAIANGFFSLSMEDGNAEGAFFFADGTIEPTNTGVSSSDSQIIISVVATSRGTATLESGEYATSTNVPDLYADVAVTILDNGNPVGREAITGGSVSISGSQNTYNITFDVPFGQGVELTGSATGTFENP
ncbi:hypothetical protein [Ekhidna sp.]